MIVLAFTIPLLLFFVIRGFLRTRRSSRTYAEFQAGQIAWQLGLDLVEGDPATNLAYRVANPEMRRSHSVARPLDLSTGAVTGAASIWSPKMYSFLLE